MLSTVVLDSHIHESPALEPWYIEHPDAPNSLCDTETHVPKAKAETFSIQHKFPHLPLYIYIYIYIYRLPLLDLLLCLRSNYPSSPQEIGSLFFFEFGKNCFFVCLGFFFLLLICDFVVGLVCLPLVAMKRLKDDVYAGPSQFKRPFGSSRGDS